MTSARASRPRDPGTTRAVRCCAALMLAALATLAPAQTVTTPAQVARPEPGASGAAPRVEPTHPVHMRRTHIERLHERLTTSAKELVERCRYESEISTLPPGGWVALTFDDGPEPGLTEHILNVLEQHRVPATFFVIGEKAELHPELLARMQALPGTQIGNHSWSHPDFHHLDAEAQRTEIDRNDALLWPTDSVARSTPKLFRYPYGNSSCEGNDHLRALGYRIAGWHVDSCDWAFDGDGSVDAHEALSCGVLAPFRHDFVGHVLSSVRAHRGGIVLLHDVHRNTVLQLDDLIRRLKEEGFSFATLADRGFTTSLR